MSAGLTTAAYLAAGALFILSLSGLSHPESARRGNLYGMVGMFIAVVATISMTAVTNYALIAPAMIIGAIIGLVVARRVAMTAMPQLVAMLHSFVGLAAVLVGFATYLDPSVHHPGNVERTIHEIEIYVGVLIGALTFTGSVIAFGKLQGVIGSKPLVFRARHWLNLGLLLASVFAGYWFVGANPGLGLTMLLAMTVMALAFGVLMVMAIGGADMPVVISMLNSYSGWAAAATGFMLSNDLLIITGALVGSSGAILSYIMCRAMNRHFLSVIAGGFGATSTTGGGGDRDADQGEVESIGADETAQLLLDADRVVVVPGYGMAVAQAQHPIAEITSRLKGKGIDVRFAIHPVAGRMPGHMNVLLAEARVPYDIVLEMDEINADFVSTDVVLVIGANDIVNPSAQTDPGSPIAGMPVLEVWNARTVVVMKRSMATGYAGVENPLFLRENTRMLFGDARTSTEAILAAL